MNRFQAGLQALSLAGIPYRPRKIQYATEDLPDQGEVDLWMRPEDLGPAEMALASAEFHRLDTPGRGGHRFFVAFDGGRWSKLDVKLDDTAGGPTWRPPRVRLSLRRPGPVIAVLGPDGAGKGTLIHGLKDRIPVGVACFYLGRGSSGRARGRGRDAGQDRGPDQSGRMIPFTAFLLRKALRDWWRLARVYRAAWRGAVVLCDRHPVEVLAIRPPWTRFQWSLERLLIERLTPAPDAVLLLDAPTELLHLRKHEHSVPVLDRWRAGYREVFVPRGATVVETSQSPEVALDQASHVVWGALADRRGW